MRDVRHPRRTRATWTHRSRGFTLIELIVVLLVVGLVLGLGLPALQQLIHRGKLEGFARQTSVMMQAARFEAIKRSRQVVVQIDTTTEQVVSWVDDNGDAVQDPGELQLGLMTLPSGVDFAAPGGQAVIEGFTTAGTTGWVIYGTDGATDLAGAFRLGDQRGNFIEVRVATTAAARSTVLKWQDAQWLELGEGGGGWEWT